jgi:hypothetical protein
VGFGLQDHHARTTNSRQRRSAGKGSGPIRIRAYKPKTLYRDLLKTGPSPYMFPNCAVERRAYTSAMLKAEERVIGPPLLATAST